MPPPNLWLGAFFCPDIAEYYKIMKVILGVVMRNNKYAVRCVDTSKRFKKDNGNKIRSLLKPEFIHACRNISFDVHHREVFGIIGPNGSGKSTLIRMLSTLLLPDSGYLEVFHRDVTKETLAVRQLINRVSVDASFFKKLSVKENLSYAARIYGIDRRVSLERARDILEKFGLKNGKMTEPIENLSRGQQQMVSIARSFMSSPNLLLLDEPTTGLDPQSKRNVQEFVVRVREEHDITVILTSHDMNEVEKLCDRIAFIMDGKIWGIGTASELKDIGGHLTLEDVFLELTGKALEEQFVNTT